MTAIDLTLATPACRGCPIRHRAVCATCEPSELSRLEGMKSYRSWSAGQTIVMEGAELDFAASIVTGCATLTRSMEDGRVQMVGLLMPSDFIGRPGRAQAPYEVVAATDVTLCMFDRLGFERLLAETPHLSTRLLEMSLDEIDAAREWMLLLGRKTAREKVATLLSIILRRAATGKTPLRAELPITREAMASYLGLTIETVSRQMTLLRKDGVISMAGARTVLCDDLAALMAEAGDDADGDVIS
ncbi:transcriptional regulator FnrL [Jannaschia rubra]|uniref:Nitrogen fixation regulation protein FixK n=1 Tax=Jannaschia rubra TaxID=282197 RepID=A0A0M6XX02_9RHOB|nr:Crp/Fnr family transcriptional regulator [Jannaschia rubra]CTQ34615.1 Nitrogen fixation regulation protein FixK [Jannaschia rubra]SFG71869.1 CRP/FNR family transcriptional regulator, anaerobic regulatory protein [Jannaschia rubra]